MKLRHTAPIVSAFVLSLTAAATAHALPSHTWVSGAGNDSTGDGTFAKPYATFQKAVNNTAAGGLISAADPGDFGSVVINNSITIDGGAQGATVQCIDGQAIAVNEYSVSDTVILRNLTIDGGFSGVEGIYYPGGGNLIVENCRIENFTYDGIVNVTNGTSTLTVIDTTISGGATGIYINCDEGVNTLRGVRFAGCGSCDIEILNSPGKLDVSNSIFTQSYYGIDVQASAAPFVVTAKECIFSFDQTAISCGTGNTVRLVSNEIIDCTTGIAATGGGSVLSDGNNIKGGLVSGSVSPTGSAGKY